MALNGSRLQVNTNGYTPPANTGSGAAGTVTGTERAAVQNATDAAVPSTIVKRDSNNSASFNIVYGITFTGNAASANVVPGVGTMSGIYASGGTYSNGQQFMGAVVPAGGVWLVTGVVYFDNPATGYNVLVNGVVVPTPANTVYTSGVLGLTNSRISHIIPFAVNGGDTVTLNAATGGAASYSNSSYLRFTRIG